MTIENIKELMDGVDLGALLPDLGSIEYYVALLARLALLAGPVIMLALGLHYFLLAPKEANYTTGYRFRWGMASVESWQCTQQVAGAIWSLLGFGLLVAMSFTVANLREMEMLAMLLLAAKRLLLQAALAVGSRLLINLIVFARYDRKGKRRLTWRELHEA